MQMRMAMWSRLAVAIVLNITAGAATAFAQTVFIRNGPPGFTIEVMVNSTTTGSAVVDTSGVTTVPAPLPGGPAQTSIDAYLFVDTCEKIRRVVIAERGVMPPPVATDCERHEIPGLYLVRRISTIVIDFAGPTPSVLLRQGRYRIRPPRVWKPAPTGLVVYGGGALTKLRDPVLIACGTVEGCKGDSAGIGYTAGATYWLTRWLGADVSYIKPPSVKASGSGQNYSFTSDFDVEVVTIGGKAGIPAGPLRFYGQGGWNYHRATATTIETISEQKQTLEYKTKGWSWGFGGGMEAWITGRLALFGEAGTAKLKGKADDDGEAVLDDRLTYIFVGARLRIGG